MRKLPLVLAMLAASAAAAPSAGAPLTPEAVTAHIEVNGTQSAREEYFSCGDESRAQGYRLVEKGSEAWLRIAARLLKDAGGCHVPGLQSAIARAMVNNPAGVLALIGSQPRLGAGDICMPFMSDQFDPDKLRAELATLGQMEAALNRVSAPPLRARNSECLQRLHEMQEYISAQISRQPGAAAP